jgi:hypothetical protein
MLIFKPRTLKFESQLTTNSAVLTPLLSSLWESFWMTNFIMKISRMRLVKLVNAQCNLQTKGRFHKTIHTLRLKFALCAHIFWTNLLQFGIMHLRLALNFLHFLPNFGCALHFMPCVQLLWNAPQDVLHYMLHYTTELHSYTCGHLKMNLMKAP